MLAFVIVASVLAYLAVGVLAAALVRRVEEDLPAIFTVVLWPGVVLIALLVAAAEGLERVVTRVGAKLP